MTFVADLHIHSKYSRATSTSLSPEALAVWAQKKGISLLGTGDSVHPLWRQELRACLIEAEEGLFRLTPQLERKLEDSVPESCRNQVRFMLQTEISSIYKWEGKVRKVHSLIYAPDFESLNKLCIRLERIGNIKSDGRPILGIDCRNLLELVKSIDDRIELIPAHIWTPWFSALGSNSGFDSIDECFRDLVSSIFAVETGLSSDPPMNWRVSALDRFTLVSNSDAHSACNLGREATLFSCLLTYRSVFEALKTGADYQGTIEFFPEEGKYHYDGHRKCHVCMDPTQSRQVKGICPVCNHKMTIGVSSRVAELADHAYGRRPPNAGPFESLLSLCSILGELFHTGPQAKTVLKPYQRLLETIGPELYILRAAPLTVIESMKIPLLSTAIARVRANAVYIAPGYDGEYGIIKAFAPGELQQLSPQRRLTNISPPNSRSKRKPAPERKLSRRDNPLESSLPPSPPTVQPLALPPEPGVRALTSGELSPQKAKQRSFISELALNPPTALGILSNLDDKQRQAASMVDGPLLITAGPGTGKTRTLTSRIAYLLHTGSLSPANVMAVTFTNRAAEEVRDRLTKLLNDPRQVAELTIGTFHSICAELLRRWGDRIALAPDFTILDENLRLEVVAAAAQACGSKRNPRTLADRISTHKNRCVGDSPSQVLEPELQVVYAAYQEELLSVGALDFDDLIAKTVTLLRTDEMVLSELRARYLCLAIDEFQDINPIQYQFVTLLAGSGRGVCAIGDPNQAIYGFRGSEPESFNAFYRDFPGTRTISLRQSYRSTDCIVEASRQLIGSLGSDLTAAAVGGDRITLHDAATDAAEAEFIVHTIERLLGGTGFFSMDSGRVEPAPELNLGFGDIAILYRLHSISDAVAEALTRSGMPFWRVGKTDDRDSVVQWLLRLAYLTVDPHNQVHWFGLLTSQLSGLNRTGVARVATIKREQRLSFETLLNDQSLQSLFPKKQRAALTQLTSTVAQVQKSVAADCGRFPLWQIAELLGIALTEDQREAITRLEVLYETNGRNLIRFIQALSLQTQADWYIPGTERISLMTIHAAKGLEFPVVFVMGCEEGVLPLFWSGNQDRTDLAEEQRLLYVAMTRSKSLLYLTHSRKRLLFGRTRSQGSSRFLAKIQNELIRHEALKALPSKPQPQGQQLELFPDQRGS